MRASRLIDSLALLSTVEQREGPAMTRQFNMNHGHPDGDLLTSILAYEWFLESKRHYNQKYTDWKTSWSREWKACTKVGLMHHVLVAIHDSAGRRRACLGTSHSRIHTTTSRVLSSPLVALVYTDRNCSMR